MHKGHLISIDLWDFKVECCKEHHMMNEGGPHANQAFDLERIRAGNRVPWCGIKVKLRFYRPAIVHTHTVVTLPQKSNYFFWLSRIGFGGTPTKMSSQSWPCCLHLFISNIAFSKEILSTKCTLSELYFWVFTLVYLSQPAESLDLGLLPQLSVHVYFVKVWPNSFFHCPFLNPPSLPQQAGLLFVCCIFQGCSFSCKLGKEQSQFHTYSVSNYYDSFACFCVVDGCVPELVCCFQNDHAHIYLALSLEMFYIGLI